MAHAAIPARTQRRYRPESTSLLEVRPWSQIATGAGEAQSGWASSTGISPNLVVRAREARSRENAMKRFFILRSVPGYRALPIEIDAIVPRREHRNGLALSARPGSFTC